MTAIQKNKVIPLLLCVTLFMFTFMFSPTPSVEAADEYDALRAKWKNLLVGGTYDPSDPDIAARITSITNGANSSWNSLIKDPNRTALWSDLSNWTSSATITNNYNRLKSMAIAYATAGSSLQGNASLASDIVSAMDWLYTNKYNETITNEFGNWWDWEIGSPQALTDTAILMYDQLTAAQISNYNKAIDRFCPDPTKRTLYPTTVEDGANRADKAQVVIIRGILGKSGTKIEQGRDALSQIFPYVTSGDGYYIDGSYIQHSVVAYTIGYGSVLLGDMAKLIYVLKDSSWAITDPNVSNVFNWVIDSYQPIIYKGAAMDMVGGRKISRSGEQSHASGRGVIVPIARLSQLAPPAQAASFKSMVKAWIQQDTTYSNYYSGLSIYDIVLLKSIMNDNTIVPSSELIKNQVFAGMDRVVHLRPGFGFGLSLFSNRITAFQMGNGENLKGWWTGLGMTYLYNNDLTQYDNNFWPTVNSYRLPGTTTDGTGSGTPKDFYFYPNLYNWVGGSSVDGLYGTAGMQFSLSQVTGSPLQGKKSWFMFGNKMVALGAGITNSNNANVETIVDNRKLNSAGNNALTVDGTVKPNGLGWSETMSGVQWAHLAGSVAGSDIGYYFPGTTTLYGLRESRTGAWRDINQGGSTTPYTNNYLSLAFEHGANPTNASYAYAMLPNKNAADMAAYASNPDISILENSTDAQAVKDMSLNAVGVNFWNDTVKTISVDGKSFISSDKKASVTTLETANQIDIGVSDPTQSNTGTINIEINRSASGPISLDPGITVTQFSPTIKLTVNVNQSTGKTFHAKFHLKAPVAAAAPVLNDPQTGVSSQVTLSWAPVGGEVGYKVKYGTTSGNYTNTLNVTNVGGLNTYTVTGLTNGTPYYFVVSAINSAGESDNSNEVMAIPTVAPNQSVTLNDVADAFVRDGTYANTNYGTDTTLYIKNDGTSYYRSAFLKFDLSSITGSVWNARIILVPTGGSTGFTNQANLVNDNSWNEKTITWNNKPAAGMQLATWTVPAAGTPITIDVTDQVKTSLTADKLLSIAVTSPTNQGNVYVTYASKENANKSYRPVIVINSKSMDSVAPATTASITSEQPEGQNGWYTHPVSITLTANDNLSGVAKTEYSLDDGVTWKFYHAPYTFDQDGKYTLSYRSTDNVGNVEAAQNITFKLDSTAPSITVTGLVYGTYSNAVDLTPIITLSDNLSGVDGSRTTVIMDTYGVQQGAVIPLYTLPFGTHTYTVTTSDMAGNVNSQTIVFQTTTSVSSLQALVTRFTKSKWIDNEGIANSLQAKLASNDLRSFMNGVEAQSGKHISSEAAAYLLRDAKYLLSQK